MTLWETIEFMTPLEKLITLVRTQIIGRSRIWRKMSTASCYILTLTPSCGYDVWFLWLCCWILLKFPHLVGGHLLRFFLGLLRTFLHSSTLGVGIRFTTWMVMDQGFQIIKRNWYVGVDQLKIVVMHWYIQYISQI